MVNRILNWKLTTNSIFYKLNNVTKFEHQENWFEKFSF